MFCHKCGNQAAEDSAFCPKCGAKLITDDPVQQEISPTLSGSLQSQKGNAYADPPQKTKWKMLPIILGAVALVLVCAIILIAVRSGNDPKQTKQAEKDNAYNVESNIEAGGSPSVHTTDAQPTEWSIQYADKIRELADESPTPLFSLVDLTGSDIPALVADYSGYRVSVFTWANGSLVMLMDSPYGAGGNLGYEYLPGGNVIRNYNNDQAGAIVYESYMKMNDAHEVVDLYDEVLSIWYFKDANSNGMMDANEPYSEKPYYYYGQTEITEEKYASYQILGDFQLISGEKSAEVILSQLGAEIETENSASGELLYKEQPIARLLGYRPEELNKIFGSPTGGTPVDGSLLFGATEYYTYDQIGFMLGDQGTVVNKTISADVVKVNGATLNQNRAGIINLLGMPGYEEQLPEDESGEGFGGYYIMEYTDYDGGIITTTTIQMPDADSKADLVKMSQYIDGPCEEDFEDFEAFDDSANVSQPSVNQQSNSQQVTGAYKLENTTKKKSSSGNVYAAPLEFVTTSAVGNVNILNPEKVRFGCKIQVVTGKNALGMYESYTIDEDGIPGGTVLTVVDAIVID